MLVVSGNMWLE